MSLARHFIIKMDSLCRLSGLLLLKNLLLYILNLLLHLLAAVTLSVRPCPPLLKLIWQWCEHAQCKKSLMTPHGYHQEESHTVCIWFWSSYEGVRNQFKKIWFYSIWDIFTVKKKITQQNIHRIWAIKWVTFAWEFESLFVFCWLSSLESFN